MSRDQSQITLTEEQLDGIDGGALLLPAVSKAREAARRTSGDGQVIKYDELLPLQVPVS